jgi:Trk K+ transport system NAD-binding subunit
MRLGQQLSALGCAVTVADKKRERVSLLEAAGLNAIELDATEEPAIGKSAALTADAVVISTGDRVQAGIYAALMLKHLKVRHVFACASDEKCARLLRQIGAEVIQPGQNASQDLAKQIVSAAR